MSTTYETCISIYILRSKKLCNEILSGYLWVVMLVVTGDSFHLYGYF